MAELIRALKWNLISLIIVAIVFVAISYERGVLNYLNASTLAPVALGFGAWAGYKIVEFKGNFAHVILAGLLVGVFGAILILIGFGIIRGIGVSSVLPISVFDVGFNVAGALIGGGFALTK